MGKSKLQAISVALLGLGGDKKGNRYISNNTLSNTKTTFIKDPTKVTTSLEMHVLTQVHSDCFLSKDVTQ